ncbi:hypothetical protein BVI2075_320083 [Burkholderia vietnamiensis]|nr:hypothetical protein BVI2075_320083 [Burkholderia vietnamiensis]
MTIARYTVDAVSFRRVAADARVGCTGN